jgi:hypothetical protein
MYLCYRKEYNNVDYFVVVKLLLIGGFILYLKNEIINPNGH